MGYIADNIIKTRNALPECVTLVAVSKFHPEQAIIEAYDAGQRIFGESRATELATKAKSLPDDIQWHFIGHLQTNKVRMVLPHISLIHSADSERLIRTIDEEAWRINRIIDILLQVHVAQEESKFGFLPQELIEKLENGMLNGLNNIRIRGVMGMASNTDDEYRITDDFKQIRATFDTLASGIFAGNNDFSIVSMGMSDDHPIAIAQGSNMVRIGSSIFGSRNY